MSGIKLIVPGMLNNPSLPILYDEPMLTTGSLLLVDTSHPYQPWPDQAYTTDSAVPNLAWRRAAELLGTGDQNSLASGTSFTVNIGSVYGHTEKTSKGGLHVIRRLASEPPPAAGAIVRIPQAVIDWIFAHRENRQFYFSLWNSITRAASSTLALFAGLTHNDANSLFTFGPDTDRPTGATKLGGRVVNPSSVGNSYHSIGVNGPVNGFGEPTGYEGAAWRVGGNVQWSIAGTGSKQSQIFYRAYIEDLTASGRTWAQADALDYALWTTEMQTAAGRNYGDTYTDPAMYP